MVNLEGVLMVYAEHFVDERYVFVEVDSQGTGETTVPVRQYVIYLMGLNFVGQK